ncbi:hypothetical protein SAMD00079811_81190 (plasmid) [Scytonema sp. HK-05]|uniref:hypothetical protein n=1 Tax=Scytonema sp. HK-05 TaxID=1137095 RepID=UPI000AD53082|nr:hypothetical protein [Scytonema sp. HK-05]BAY50490.1 hypothetical protein SAMD00079811_81190 [Scytonema sp. HK-05]
MNISRQSELDLWQSLETASKFPEMADLQSLLEALERTISKQPLIQQLHIAGDALVQLSRVCAARAELMMSQWEHQYNPTEPVVDLESCVDLFVQSLSLDVADLFCEPDSVQYPDSRKKKLSQKADSSTVGEVDKAALLNIVDELLAEQTPTEIELADQIINLAHEENVEEWIIAIAQHMAHIKTTIRLSELQKALNMPLVEVWLGLLLGGFTLEHRGDFYESQDIWVSDQ